ncbi:MAG: class I SAM-dependent methyltransferase [Alphaproteobacteria bacterium]
MADTSKAAGKPAGRQARQPADTGSPWRSSVAPDRDNRAWFEQIYRQADGDVEAVPWGRRGRSDPLARWLDDLAADPANAAVLNGAGRRALVVGCGLGGHAVRLAGLGFTVTAFDIAETAVAWAAERHAGHGITFVVADLLRPPAEWRGGFDLIVEAMTLQTLPGDGRHHAMRQLAAMLMPGGHLLLVASGRDAGQSPEWPLSEEQLAGLERAGLVRWRFDIQWREMAGERRRLFRAVYQRPPDGAAKPAP